MNRDTVKGDITRLYWWNIVETERDQKSQLQLESYFLRELGPTYSIYIEPTRPDQIDPREGEGFTVEVALGFSTLAS